MILRKILLLEKKINKALLSEISTLRKIVGVVSEQEKSKAIDLMLDDDKKINELMSVTASYFMNYSFKYNKLSKLFHCGIHFIQDQLSSYEPVIDGTSLPNCAQTAYLTILRIRYEALIPQEREILGENQHLLTLVTQEAYNVSYSAGIHSTSLPESVTLPSHLQDWFYFYKDEFSPRQGELLVPTLGYAYGGSRGDSRHKYKEFKSEDCSSSVSKWVGSEIAFTTEAMEKAYNGDCNNEHSCNKILEHLLPSQQIKEGNIFVFRKEKAGHTGIVTKVLNSTCFDSLSYSRWMPEIEGFVHKVECMNLYNDRKYFFFETKLHLSGDEL